MRGEPWGLAVVLAASLAAAEPYPRALVERPLLLPEGLTQGTLAIAMSDQTAGASRRARLVVAAPRVVVGLFGGELDGTATLALARTAVLDADLIEPDRLQAARIGARFAIAQDLALGGEVVYGGDPDPLGRVVAHYEPRATIARRLAGAHSALELGGHAGVAMRPDDETADGDTGVWGVLGATLRVRAQLSPTVAFDGRATLRFLHDFHATTTEQRDRFAQDYGLGMLWSLAPQVDVFGTLELVTRVTEETRVTAGIQLRSAP